MNRILFVGANSIIASSVIKKILNEKKKIKIDVIIRKNFLIKDKRIKVFKCDINRNISIKKKKYDCIFYAVSPSSKKRFTEGISDSDYLKTNIIGSLSFSKFLLGIRFKKFIFLSSGIVYGRFNSSSSHETNKLNIYPRDTLNAYGISKIASEIVFENICKIKKAKYISCRIFGIFINQFTSSTMNYLLNNFVYSAIKKKKIFIRGNPKSLVSYWDINNLTNCLYWLIFKSKQTGSFNLGSSEKISIKSLAKLVANFFEKKIKIIINKKKSEQMIYVPDVKKISKFYKKYDFVPIKECIRLMVNTLKNYYKIP